MDKVLIVGTGGLAREFTSWASRCTEIVGYASSNRSEHGHYHLPGILFPEDFTTQSVGTNLAVIAIGDPLVRARIQTKLADLGFFFPSFAHTSSVVSDQTIINAGVVVSPHCVIGPNVRIGRFSYINFGCGIGHDVIIGDFCQINPGVQLGGSSKIGDRVLIGSGAVVLQRVGIGNGARVASGSVVFSTVPASTTVMGNPAKRVRPLEDFATEDTADGGSSKL